MTEPFHRLPARRPSVSRDRMRERKVQVRTHQARRTCSFYQSPIILVTNLRKSYQTARGELTLFRDLNLEVKAGEMVAIVGQSGAGKSTLLHMLGALDAPSAGTVYCASTHVAQLTARQAAAFRNRELGMFAVPLFAADSRHWKMWPCRCWRVVHRNVRRAPWHRTG